MVVSAEHAFAGVPIDVLVDVLDEDLAAKLFAEKGDVRANHGPEIEQQWLLPSRQHAD